MPRPRPGNDLRRPSQGERIFSFTCDDGASGLVFISVQNFCAVLYVPICVNLFLSLFYLFISMLMTNNEFLHFPQKLFPKCFALFFLESHTLMNKCTKINLSLLFTILVDPQLVPTDVSPIQRKLRLFYFFFFASLAFCFAISASRIFSILALCLASLSAFL